MVQTVKARRTLQSVKTSESPPVTGKSAATKVAETNGGSVARVKSTRPRDGVECGPLGPSWPFANPTPPPTTTRMHRSWGRTMLEDHAPVDPRYPRGDGSMQMLVYSLIGLVVVIGAGVLWAWLK